MKDDTELRKEIRKRLVELRKENHLSQTELANIMGKSKNAVGSWEQGLSLPDIETLYRLAKYYKKSLEYMFGESDS